MILLVCVLCLAWAFPAMAQENPETAEVQTDTAADLNLSETQAQNASQPRLMVSEYHCGILTPDQESTVEIVFKNYSSTKAVYNIKLSAPMKAEISDPPGSAQTMWIGSKPAAHIYGNCPLPLQKQQRRVNIN